MQLVRGALNKTKNMRAVGILQAPRRNIKVISCEVFAFWFASKHKRGVEFLFPFGIKIFKNPKTSNKKENFHPNIRKISLSKVFSDRPTIYIQQDLWMLTLMLFNMILFGWQPPGSPSI